MTTTAEQIATAETARTEALDLAQQRFRAAIEQPVAAYHAATATARAELESAEALAHRNYAEAVNAAMTPAVAVGPAGQPIPLCGAMWPDFGACTELYGHPGQHRDAVGKWFRFDGE